MVKPLHDHSAAINPKDKDHDEIINAWQGQKLSDAENGFIPKKEVRQQNQMREARSSIPSIEEAQKPGFNPPPPPTPKIKINPYSEAIERANNMSDNSPAAPAINTAPQEEVLNVDPREIGLMLNIVLKERDVANTKNSHLQARIQFYEEQLKAAFDRIEELSPKASVEVNPDQA